jgi:SAM-dependent methyltransferase
MVDQMSERYIPTSNSQHGIEEERQWARIVASTGPVSGLVLIFAQKLCTAFHEFEPAWRNGALNPTALDYFRGRLVSRAHRLLQVLETNNLTEMTGVKELRSLLAMIQDAKSLEALAMLAEPVHNLSHSLSDALETRTTGDQDMSPAADSVDDTPTTPAAPTSATPPSSAESRSVTDNDTDPQSPDNIYAYNRQRWEALVKAEALFTRPWFNLDADEARERLDPAGLLGDVADKDVLCLAAGGGQQSAAFALLGAHVTVFDISEGQLARDREAARHYGSEIATVQGDMRDLAALAADAFDIVWQPYALNFVPDCRPVFEQVARVLRPGGLYHVAVANPFACGMGTKDWVGEGYLLRRPYVQGAEITYSDEDWVFRQSPGEGGATKSHDEIAPPREYRQTLGRLFNGLVDNGFALLRLVTWADHAQNLAAEPGTWEHFVSFLPPWFHIWTRYRPDVDLVKLRQASTS